MKPPPDLPPREAAAARPVGGDPWRAEVGAFRALERRRRFPLGVHVGAPGGTRSSAEVPWPVPQGYDAGLRLDLVTGLLDALLEERSTLQDPTDPVGVPPGAAAWLTRPGEPVLHDHDLEWYSAAAHGFSAYGVRLMAFRTVTRTGWLDVVSGEQRVWRRLRL